MAKGWAQRKGQAAAPHPGGVGGRRGLGRQKVGSGGQQGAAPCPRAWVEGEVQGVKGGLREGTRSSPLPQGCGQKMGKGDKEDSGGQAAMPGGRRVWGGAEGGLWGGRADSPVVVRRQTSRRNSLCLVRCLCRAFSRMPRGCSARATASSSSGSRSHHHPLCISARQHQQLSPAPGHRHRRHGGPGGPGSHRWAPAAPSAASGTSAPSA